MLSKSLETLAVRVDRHCENALKLAEFLEGHEKVNWVRYPFLKSHPKHEVAKKQMKAGGCVVAFEVKGGLSLDICESRNSTWLRKRQSKRRVVWRDAKFDIGFEVRHRIVPLGFGHVQGEIHPM